jgi:hypothetical protein
VGTVTLAAVAVIPKALVYGSDINSFCWNEGEPAAMTEKGVRLFDLRTQVEELKAHLQTGINN